jgi:tRNA pseudouridine55 synthase
VDGIINLHKPVGITSAKALYRVRKTTGQRRSGHGGTLDPAASGVLLLCMGRATKLVESIMDQPKVYRATARLDIISESSDSDGATTPVTVESRPPWSRLVEACAWFEGEIMQTPPAISAVKIGGVPAYKRHRLGQSFEIRPRGVRIDWIHVRSYDWPFLTFEMCCGRGTYVRSLIRDLGERLATGGCLTALERTRIGPFAIEDARDFDVIEAATDPGEYLVDLDSARRWLDPAAIEIPPRPLTAAS